jgi:hypothetical protein
MKSAFECFQAAAKCEEHARTCRHQANVKAYHDAVQSWRTLGVLAKRLESGEIKVASRAPNAAAREYAGKRTALRVSPQPVSGF